MLRIDGSHGEGGGQILRTAVSLATALETSIEIYNIRANRPKPGLRPQHLSSIQSIATISQAETSGLFLNSTKITFFPNKIISQDMKIDIGTAGSIPLLLQSLIQSICISGKTYNFSILGGTDVNWSPSADYFRRLVIPILKTLGFLVSISIPKRGFFPRGNGQINLEIKSPKTLNALSLNNPAYENITIDSISTSDKKNFAQIQCKSAQKFLEKHSIYPDSINHSVCDSSSSGSVICISSCSDHSLIGSDALTNNDITAEQLAISSSKKFLFEYNYNCTIDHHLADKVNPLLSLSKEPSAFLTSSISSHLQTNLELSKLLTGMTYKISRKNKFCYSVSINP